MHTEKSKNLALGVFILAIAIGGFLFVNPTGAPITKGIGGITWRTLPFIYSGLLFILACLFLGLTIWQGRLPSAAEDEIEASGVEEVSTQIEPPAARLMGIQLATLRRLAVVTLLIIYSQALNAFGFAIATPPFLLAVLFVFGRTKLGENILVSTVGGLVLWFLFSYLLRMPLSGAIWDPLTPALNHFLRALGG